jgi:hypothetical protein
MAKKKKKLRPLGEITSDMEPLIQEMVYEHSLQVHEIIGILVMYLRSHCPESIEEYEDGMSPQIDYFHPHKRRKNG